MSRSIMMLLEVYDVYVWCDKSDSRKPKYRRVGETKIFICPVTLTSAGNQGYFLAGKATNTSRRG